MFYYDPRPLKMVYDECITQDVKTTTFPEKRTFGRYRFGIRRKVTYQLCCKSDVLSFEKSSKIKYNDPTVR